MDKRKLIGAIIGVTMFALLIVGATFAWLTFNATILGNSATTGGSMNFSVNYIKGQNISTMQVLGTGTPSNVETVTTIKASKIEGSAPGTLYLYLNTNASESDDIMITSGIIRYGICIGSGTCATFTKEGIAQADNESTKIVLYSGDLQSTETLYNVYVWLDGPTLTSSHLDKKYSGYITAEAKQVGAT